MLVTLDKKATVHGCPLPCGTEPFCLARMSAALALQGLQMGAGAAELLPRRHFAPLVHYFPYFAERLPGTMMLHLAFIATAGVLWPLQVSCAAQLQLWTMVMNGSLLQLETRAFYQRK